MKMKIVSIVLAIAGIFTLDSNAQTSSDGFGIAAGALSLKSWEGMSEGPASLEGRQLTYATLGLSYKKRFWDIGAGGLFGGRAYNESVITTPQSGYGCYKQPAKTSTFFVEAPGYGWYGETGLTYRLGHFYAGGQGQLTSLWMQSGANNETLEKRWWINASAGPKVGLEFGRFALEGSYQWGSKANLFAFLFNVKLR